jgi:hypothetical protein
MSGEKRGARLFDPDKHNAVELHADSSGVELPDVVWPDES